MTTRITRGALACALLTSTCLIPQNADAETKLENRLPDRFVLSPGGVDMRSGRYMYSETDLVIGSDGEGKALALTRMTPNYVGGHANPFGNFSHNWDIMLMESRVSLITGGLFGPDFRMHVHFGGRALTFETRQAWSGYQYKSDGPGAYLTYSGTKESAATVYTFTAPDGTILRFRPIGSYDCADQDWHGAPRRCAFVSEMIEPDGTRYSFDYNSGGSVRNGSRLKRVVSSRGYALLLEGSGSRVTKACVVNLTQATLPADDLCPQGAPAATYAYNANGKLVAATDPTGATSGFTYENGMGFIKPGEATPWLTNYVGMDVDEEDNPKEIVGAQVFADGQSYSYGFGGGPVTNQKPDPTIAGGVYRDAAGHTIYVTFGFPILPGTGYEPHCPQFPCNADEPDGYLNYTYQQTDGPVAVMDALGRTTTADYCDPVVMNGAPSWQMHRCYMGPITSFTDPEGIKTEFEYDGLRNVTKTTQYPKPGQEGLTPIVAHATYDCLNAKSCTKPASTTDAKNQRTDYTYAPEHGGILTETGPAVNGIRPQKRYEYAQRHARIKNASGGYSPAASPVWLLIRERFCKTTAAAGQSCVGGAADEVITDYDYGPDDGPNNLWLRGTVVDAGGLNLRTCYSYDAQGNRISETKPKAGLASCS